MIKTLTLELMRGKWMLHEDAVPVYAAMARDILLGKEIDTGWFGTLTLPDVPDNVAMVVMNGPLTKSDVCGAQGTRSLSLEVTAAANNPSISSIILLSENCPGGSVDGIQELNHAIAAANLKKPVVGAVSNLACSAAVFALAPCEEIYCTADTDFVGCIGVMAHLRNPKKYNPDEAYEVEVVSALSPDKNAEFKDLEVYRSTYLDPLCELFHSAVKDGRGDRLKLDKENVLSGKTYIASDAHKYGLTDGTMPFNKVVARSKFLTQKRYK
ncbi:S49 family peptidase [Niabella sp. 22666]|uniref:S49 family peptidase n=1 Tax=Niabella sp. 22666 TaxID=3453954 RepID=UPI003F8381B3